MLSLRLPDPAERPLRILCLGAHSDDIEIGCGGTILRLLRDYQAVEAHWVVFSAVGKRGEEATASADRFLRDASTQELTLHQFRDGYFPFQGAEIKDVFEALKEWPEPDLIFTHHGADRHQDHRLISELTWNTFRDHLILEYEIPKYDGGLMTPSVYVGMDPEIRKNKLEYLSDIFVTQANKGWFSDETFLGLMRLRGIESASEEGYAEGFHARKMNLTL